MNEAMRRMFVSLLMNPEGARTGDSSKVEGYPFTPAVDPQRGAEMEVYNRAGIAANPEGGRTWQSAGIENYPMTPAAGQNAPPRNFNEGIFASPNAKRAIREFVAQRGWEPQHDDDWREIVQIIRRLNRAGQR